MTNFVKLDELDSFQLQDLRASSYHLARNEVDNRGIADPDGTEAVALSLYLFEEAGRWASFDEADQDDESYQVVMDEFFALSDHDISTIFPSSGFGLKVRKPNGDVLSYAAAEVEAGIDLGGIGPLVIGVTGCRCSRSTECPYHPDFD